MGVTAVTKVLRASIVATIATFSALALHVLAGGHAPAMVAVLLPWVLSIAVSIELVGPSLARWRVGLAAAISQVFFHLLFTLGGAPSANLTGLTDAHALHHGNLAVDMTTVAGMEHGGMSMVWAHVAAAAIAYAAMRGGHRLYRAAVVACRALRGFFLPEPSTSAELLCVAPGLAVVSEIAAPRLSARRTPVGLRAPPPFA